MKQATKTFDIIVIGAGAGAKISSPSAALGYKVALCEKDRLGGTCLNRGCIPSKMLIHPADVMREMMEEGPRLNLKPPAHIGVDFETLVIRVASVIDEESFSINPKIEANPNINWFKKPVKFVAPKLLQVGDTEEYITAEKIFIAAGSRPVIPNIPGLKDTPYMTSTEALRQAKQPKELVVIGGGYIAVELAHYFASLGTKVTVLARSTLIRHADAETAKEFSNVFTKRPNLNVKLYSHATNILFDKEKHLYTIDIEEGKELVKSTITADQLLVASGVQPNADLLDCVAGGIELKDGGFIKVDKFLRTNQPGVWAFGDIAGNFLFRHSANFEGEYLMETVIRVKELEEEGGSVYPIDYIGMPSAVFSYPQVASVGESEEELIARGASYVKGVNKYSSSAMGMALRSTHGFVKLLIEKGTRRILGCHIVGDDASILIHEVIPLMRLNGKLEDILYSVHIHPALSELVRNAARLARGALLEAGDKMPLKLKLK